MKVLSLYRITFILTLTILQFSCATIKPLEYRDFRNLTIYKFGLLATELKMELVYYNPNNFSLQLKFVDLDIFLDNIYVGHAMKEELVSITQREEFTIPVRIDLDMKNLLKNGMGILVRNEGVLKLTGSVKLGKGNVFKSFPVNYEEKQKFSFF